MLGLFQRPTVELVSLRERTLAFFSHRSFQPGKSVRVRLVHPGGENRTRLRVDDVRPLWKGGFLHTARLLGGGAPMKEPYDRFRLEQEEPLLRSQPRPARRVRVLSVQLPGFRAVSVDLHHKGIQLETESALEPGSVLDLVLELDEERVSCRGRVAWCRRDGSRRCRAGLEFLDVPARTQKRLSNQPVRVVADEPTLVGKLVGYARNSRLELRVETSAEPVTLEFSGVRIMVDRRGLAGDGFIRVASSTRSPLLLRARARQAVSLTEGSPLCHYRFLRSDGIAVFEIVAHRTALPEAWSAEKGAPIRRAAGA